VNPADRVPAGRVGDDFGRPVRYDSLSDPRCRHPVVSSCYPREREAEVEAEKQEGGVAGARSLVDVVDGRTDLAAWAMAGPGETAGARQEGGPPAARR